MGEGVLLAGSGNVLELYEVVGNNPIMTVCMQLTLPKSSLPLPPFFFPLSYQTITAVALKLLLLDPRREGAMNSVLLVS